MKKQGSIKLKNWVEKMDYLTFRKNGKYSECQIAKERFGVRLVPVNALHHAGIHNTEVSRKLYPSLVHSILNVMPVNNDFHLSNGDYGRKSQEWAKKWEDFLNNPIHWKCKSFVNSLLWPKTKKDVFVHRVCSSISMPESSFPQFHRFL